MSPTATNQQLWQLYTEGDKQAFGKLYERYHEKLMLYCLGFLKDIAIAENAASDTLIKLMQHPDPHHVNNFESWLFRVARNNCITYLRQVNRRQSIWDKIAIFLTTTSYNQATQQIDNEEWTHIKKEQLSNKEYAAWELHEQGYNDEEIAQLLEITHVTQ